MTLPSLYLKRREERRLRAGHPWVFSNEVDVARSPLTGFEPGSFVNVTSDSGQILATAYVNPATLICARVVSRRPDRALDAPALTERVRRALAQPGLTVGGFMPGSGQWNATCRRRAMC